MLVFVSYNDCNLTLSWETEKKNIPLKKDVGLNGENGKYNKKRMLHVKNIWNNQLDKL